MSACAFHIQHVQPLSLPPSLPPSLPLSLYLSLSHSLCLHICLSLILCIRTCARTSCITVSSRSLSLPLSDSLNVIHVDYIISLLYHYNTCIDMLTILHDSLYVRHSHVQITLFVQATPILIAILLVSINHDIYHIFVFGFRVSRLAVKKKGAET